MCALQNLDTGIPGGDVVRLSDEDESRQFDCRILDVRANADDHLPGSARVPVQGDSLRAHDLPAHLLPSRQHPFVVVAETPRKSRYVAVSLRGRGYQAGYCLDGIPAEALRPGDARGEMWRPDHFLEQCVPLLPPPGAGPALDLGAGSGRDGVFLATHGYDCLLVDRHAEALAMAHERAERRAVQVRTLTADLRDTSRVPDGPHALVICIRFLRRNVLAHVDGWVAPGGMFLLHTFTGDPRRFAGPPRRAHLRFQSEEVERFFPAVRWHRVVGPVVETSADNAWIAMLLEKSR